MAPWRFWNTDRDMIGLNIETRITQITEYDLSITNLNDISSFQIEPTLTETAMKVNLALFIVEMESNETIYAMGYMMVNHGFQLVYLIQYYWGFRDSHPIQ